MLVTSSSSLQCLNEEHTGILVGLQCVFSLDGTTVRQAGLQEIYVSHGYNYLTLIQGYGKLARQTYVDGPYDFHGLPMIALVHEKGATEHKVS